MSHIKGKLNRQHGFNLDKLISCKNCLPEPWDVLTINERIDQVIVAITSAIARASISNFARRFNRLWDPIS
jgi:hypothetical protein